MNDQLEKNSIKLLFYRYKDSIYFQLFVIVFVIVIGINLFFRIVLPQIEGWFSIRNEIIATRDRIDTINRNISFLSNLDKQQVEAQFDVATTALPFEKDFGPIIDAITDSSLQAGVSLEDFTFQVGDVASVSAKNVKNQIDTSTVNVTVFVAGDINGVNKFLREINKKLPLAEVVEINGDAFTTTIDLKFYQKHFPTIVFKDDQPLSTISKKDAELLDEFAGWRHIDNTIDEVATESSLLIPLF